MSSIGQEIDRLRGIIEMQKREISELCELVLAIPQAAASLGLIPLDEGFTTLLTPERARELMEMIGGTAEFWLAVMSPDVNIDPPEGYDDARLNYLVQRRRERVTRLARAAASEATVQPA